VIIAANERDVVRVQDVRIYRRGVAPLGSGAVPPRAFRTYLAVFHVSVRSNLSPYPSGREGSIPCFPNITERLVRTVIKDSRCNRIATIIHWIGGLIWG
jgi:hypothetical protein